MKKTFVVLAIAGLVLIIMAATVLAFSTASGCVVDGNTGQPWTHGGVIRIEYPAGSGNFLQYTTNLDTTTGCFDAQLWQSGVHQAATIHIEPAAGPLGTPDPILCGVPADNTTENFDCGTNPTNTGPNAVTWTAVNANTSSGVPLEAAAFGFLALILAGGGIALWRQQRLTS